jgi:hypothetical protein
MDVRNRAFVQRFVPEAPVYSEQVHTLTEGQTQQTVVEPKVASIATALLAQTLPVKRAATDPWAPLRTHEMWATDAVTHSIGVIPLRVATQQNAVAQDNVATTILSSDVRPRLLDLDEVARGLSFRGDTAQRLQQERLLPGVGFGNTWFVSLADLNQWLDQPMATDERAKWDALLAN